MWPYILSVLLGTPGPNRSPGRDYSKDFCSDVSFQQQKRSSPVPGPLLLLSALTLWQIWRDVTSVHQPRETVWVCVDPSANGLLTLTHSFVSLIKKDEFTGVPVWLSRGSMQFLISGPQVHAPCWVERLLKETEFMPIVGNVERTKKHTVKSNSYHHSEENTGHRSVFFPCVFCTMEIALIYMKF